MQHDVILHPIYFNAELEKTIRRKLMIDVEGHCFGQRGFVIIVTTITNIGPGVLSTDANCGMVNYSVKFKAVVYRPFKGEVLEAVVKQVNKVGIFAEVGPLSCFVSHNSIPEGFSYNTEFNPHSYRNEKDCLAIACGDPIRIKVVGTRIDASGIFAIGTVMDDFLGPM
jgi:DNA-directed RNA polymerase subunit E'/Rpb7